MSNAFYRSTDIISCTGLLLCLFSCFSLKPRSHISLHVAPQNFFSLHGNHFCGLLSSLMYSVYLRRIFSIKYVAIFFYLGHPVNEQVFFPEIFSSVSVNCLRTTYKGEDPLLRACD